MFQRALAQHQNVTCRDHLHDDSQTEHCQNVSEKKPINTRNMHSVSGFRSKSETAVFSKNGLQQRFEVPEK